ncbi:MAG: flagellar hook capping FlgD N-terminal domain-containing protein [Acidimicrobiia bacterium]|nr:flagellar hook capping FlgD N-terminal domain-containing protein [Acidimicrobiia bacterium]
MIESTGSATAAAAAESASASSGLGSLDSDAFLKLLVAQMKYQNPLAPTDASAMLAQTAQFTTVETLQSISETNQALLGFQQTTMALSVVGKEVNAYSLDGTPVQGKVETVRFTADGPFLALDNGVEIPMSNVIEVSAPPTDTE